MSDVGVYSLKVAKTLYQNFFRAKLFDGLNRLIGRLTIVPGMPLDRSLVPKDAPVVKGYLLVIVEDADINKDNLIDFEERASMAILKRFATETIAFEHCEFYYPSPAFVFGQPDAAPKGEPGIAPEN
jgi:hypothetical protein